MKTVYILGAGFSKGAGAPTQAELIQTTFDFYKKSKENFYKKNFLIFQNFLFKQLNISKKHIKSVQLEDIFTPLDRCISENAQYRGIPVKELSNIREAILDIIGKTIHLSLQNNNAEQEYIDIFAKKIISLSKKREANNYKNSDLVSVISTNWDTLVDDTIYKHIQIQKDNAVVDYCCHISSLEANDETVKPGLEILGRGGFNVKLLKLHGSLNWLQCPRCMRLYVGFQQKENKEQHSCRHCDENFPEAKNNHILYSNLIMPTFIKDLTNPQYKIVWQNAGIEISEADELVFIGYSLPSADFEMRQLLSRMTRKNAKITVVSYCKDKGQIQSKKTPWQTFFGKRKVSFNFDGASEYIKKEMT